MLIYSLSSVISCFNELFSAAKIPISALITNHKNLIIISNSINTEFFLIFQLSGDYKL